jgi:hypothetical protein
MEAPHPDGGEVVDMGLREHLTPRGGEVVGLGLQEHFTPT